jgi:IS30 family transposase
MNEDSNQKKSYKHLNEFDREIIAVLKECDCTVREIAKAIGRSFSTVSRELKRNSTGTYKISYSGLLAHKQYKNRKKYSSCRIRLKSDFIRNYVISKLKQGISPELISGRLRVKHGECISHEAIYLFVYEERQDLIEYLVRSHKKRRKRGSSGKKQCSRIPNRVSIDERSKEINERQEYGHWEADTAVSRESKTCLAIMVERSLRIIKIRKMKNKSAKEMKRCVIDMLKEVPSVYRKTITYDNGLENVLHDEVNDELGTQSYFCNPYHSWEKGSVENSIGLIRRYFPKKTDFACISTREIKEVEERLNNRPRKCLNFSTAQEAWNVALAG